LKWPLRCQSDFVTTNYLTILKTKCCNDFLSTKLGWRTIHTMTPAMIIMTADTKDALAPTTVKSVPKLNPNDRSSNVPTAAKMYPRSVVLTDSEQFDITVGWIAYKTVPRSRLQDNKRTTKPSIHSKFSLVEFGVVGRCVVTAGLS
jgi:hypothetical protein